LPSRPLCIASGCWIRLILLVLGAISSEPAIAQGTIFVTDAGSPAPSTCTLAQAIATANDINGVFASAIGSASDTGACDVVGPGFAGPYSLLVIPTQITLTTIDNYWYGPNALPPIASTISIGPVNGILRLIASHTGDPTPATANAFRFFYVSGGLELPAGSLALYNTVLQGGNAKGGNGGTGGGGAGMGGAIFNQGSLSLTAVSLIGNTAQGGSTAYATTGGGGMGQDGYYVGVGVGGGFGWASPPSAFGGNGGTGNASGGGGGGGFIAGSDGGNAGVGTGGGKGGLGSAGPSAGDGGNGYTFPNSSNNNGGNFGMAGVSLSGGGAGAGGGDEGGGGFGGGSGGVGGGISFNGGFGGGGGFNVGAGGFGGGNGNNLGGGGGMGAGGAIFNHTGTVSLLNVTATSNLANGGTPAGSGLGAALFNLNGKVTIDFSTFAGNSVGGNNGRAGNFGPEDATVYSIAFGNKIEDGTASSASLIISNSIIHGTHADGGLQNDVSVNVVNGVNTNNSSLNYAGKNFIGQSYTVNGVTQTGTSPSTADPLLGALSLYRSSQYVLPVLPIGANSPGTDKASSCLEADGSTTLTTDERGALRPYGSQCDVGAYEFDGDYIFAANNDVML
jgi:hypothetical protein